MIVSLADELAEALPSLLAASPLGATAKGISVHLAADVASVRSAMTALDAEGRVKLVRRKGGRTLHLVSVDDPVLACRVCHAEFERPRKSRRVTCSKSCGVALSWRNPDTKESRTTGIKAQRATPAGRANSIERNHRRWAKPGEREKLSERNRERWADPIVAAEMAATMRATNGTEENRIKASDIRKAAWDDPETRGRYEAGIRHAKAQPDARENASEALRQRWRDPAQRPILLAATRRNGVKATAARARKSRPADAGPLGD